MRISFGLALLVLALALGACGAAAGPGAQASPSPSPVQVVTEADSGQTISLAVGQTADLRLSNRYTWSAPQVSGGAVRVAGGAAAADYHEWTLTAVARGTATVTSGGRVACSPGDVCPGAVRAFSVTVAVT